MKHFFIFLIYFACMNVNAQTHELPYHELLTPDHRNYTAGSVLARFIDGLGFRFYWATEGLREEDCEYRPTPETRSTRETIQHIYSLSKRIYSVAYPEKTFKNPENPSIEDIRAETLQLIKQSADAFRQNENLSESAIQTRNGDISLWYLMNGPVNDAIWHCGQIASFRRTSGNPINPKVNHFFGTVGE